MIGLFCHFLRTCLYKGFFTLMEFCWSKDPGEKHCTTVEFCTMATSPLFQTDYSLRGLDFQARVFAKIAVYFSCPKCLLTVISFKLLFLLGRESNNEGGKKAACSKGVIWKENGHSKHVEFQQFLIIWGMGVILAFQNENRPLLVLESMFVTHFRHRVASRDISKCTLFCLQYLDKTDLGLSISTAKLCLSGHPQLPLYS